MTTRKKVESLPVPKKATKAAVVTKKIVAIKRNKILPDTDISIVDGTKSKQPNTPLLKKTQKTKRAPIVGSQSMDKKNELLTAVKGQLTIRPSSSLALLSPYRLPIDSHKLAVGTARFGGVFFVMIGAIFTLYFAAGPSNANEQLAYVAGSTALPTLSAPVNCLDHLQYVSASCANSVDKTPDATFNVDGPIEALSGTVRVTINVPHAERVKLAAYYKTGERELFVGKMNNPSKDVWEFAWNTSQFQDGDYKLKTIIENYYGSYEELDSNYIVVSNHPLEVPIANTATASSSGTTLPTPLSVEPSASRALLSASPIESVNEFRFDIEVLQADSIKLYAFHKETGKNELLGNAYKVSNTLWKYRWLSGSRAIGDYSIKAQVITSGGVSVMSNEVQIKKVEKLITSAIVTSSSTVSATEANTPVHVRAELEPQIDVDIQSSLPLVGTVAVKINVLYGAFVEVYAQGKQSLIKKYLGVARLVDHDTWIYQFDTTQVPNNEYTIIANVKNQFGTYEGKSASVQVQNLSRTAYTPVQEERIQNLKEVSSQIEPTVEKTVLPPSQVPVQNREIPSTQEVETVREDVTKPSSEYIASFKKEIDLELARLAATLRSQDPNSVAQIKKRLDALKETIINSGKTTQERETLQRDVDSFFKQAIERIEKDVEKTNLVIAERTKEKAVEDTDKDGITNYDEVAIYNTDPFSADSDKDGFIDSAEILNGYDPTNPSSEVLISYESPKDTGIVREDVLEVVSITAAKPNDTEVSASPIAQAIISGRAFPNSFVTLYIFSTPLVVTIKTEADGSWNYRFDKELEDGEHEVYVGVTDNAGKLVAKSNPFTFVKKAEAFTQGESSIDDVPLPALATTENTFASQYMVYLVLSISVVAIGLVLILLGLHLDSRQRKVVLLENEEVLV